MQKESQTPIQELQSELSDYRSRAIQIGYKNKLPTLPKSTKLNQHGLPANHLMVGFHKRLTNWIKGLEQLEFPGGKPSLKKPEPVKTEVVSVDQLVQKYVAN